MAASADGGGCAWTVEELAHELPIAPPTSGKPALLRVAYDPLQDEIAVLFKPRATDSSTRTLFQRFGASGRALGDPMELQAELVPSRSGASWDHGLIGVVSLNGAWVALWSQVAFLFEAAGYVFSDGAIVARRIVAGVAEDSPRALLTTQSHLRAHDLHWTGSTLAIAAVQDSGLWQSGLGQAIVQVYRFDPDLEQQGDAITIPEQDSARPLVEVKSPCLRGDERRLGLSFVGWRAEQQWSTDRMFALIDGDRVTAVSEDPRSLDFHVHSSATLGHGGGYFLSCTSIPPNCVLLDEQSADRVGAPLELDSAAVPRATIWQGDRFWVAASTGDAINPAQRLLGWIDAQGNQGYQRLSQDPRTPAFATTTISTFLLRGKTPDELLWIDNTRYTDSSDGSVLLRLTRSCP